MKKIVIIPSGGTGSRIGEPLPKQYNLINGKELLAYTLEVFQKSEQVDAIIVAAQEKYFNLIQQISEKYNFHKIKKIVKSGKERQDSVYNALRSLSANNDDLIIVNDAARPLLDKEILERAIKTAEEFDNAIVCINARDTLVKADSFVKSYIDRESIYYVQTPQIFRYNILMNSMKKAYEENFYGTDESMLVTRVGYKVKLVEGSILNFKITTKNDLELFSKFSKCIFTD